jgi:tetratricopeptide (TPR) repeat protein
MGDDDTVTMALANSLAAYNIVNSGATLDALPYFERALAIVKGDDPSVGVRADLSEGYGRALADLGRYDEALSWEERGIARAKADGNSMFAARGLVDLGSDPARELGELERAAQDLEEADALMRVAA